MPRVHVGLNLEDKAGELLIEWLDDLTTFSLVFARGWGKLQVIFQEGLDPKISQGRPEENWCLVPTGNLISVKFVAGNLD